MIYHVDPKQTWNAQEIHRMLGKWNYPTFSRVLNFSNTQAFNALLSNSITTVPMQPHRAYRIK